MNKANNKVLMTIKESKKKSISQIAAIGRKYKILKYPILLFLVLFIFIYNFTLYFCSYFKMKERTAKAIATAMCVVLCVTSIDITALAYTGDAGSDKEIVGISSLSEEIANQMVKPDATLEDIKLPESLDVHVSYQVEKEIEVEVEEEEKATPTPTPSVEPTPSAEPTPSVEVKPTEEPKGEEVKAQEETNKEENQESNEPEQNVPADEPTEESNQHDDTQNENTQNNNTQGEDAESQPDGEQIAKITYGEYDSVETVYVPMTYYAAEPSEEEVVVETLEKSDVADKSDDKKTESQNEIKKETVIEKVEEDVTVSAEWSIDEENSSKAEFKDLEAGEKYIFVPTITEDGYKLAEDVELPVITVTVDENQAAFEKSVTIDGVVITVTADEGVFPEDATIEARKVTASEEKEVEEAIDEVRDEEKNVAVSYTFDITAYDQDGNEIEPDTSKGSVKVTFKMAEIANTNLETDVYHVEETDGGLNAESLEVKISDVETLEENVEESVEAENGEAKVSDEVTVETNGFSYYTVEFTYGELQYVLDGGEQVALKEVMEKVGLEGEPKKVVFSSPELVEVKQNEEGEWILTSLHPFYTEEELTITIAGESEDIDYVVKVTDDMPSGDWQDWNITTDLPKISGYYCLTDDVEMATTWDLDDGNNVQDIYLDLRGKAITFNGVDGDNGSAIVVAWGNKLHLYDSVGGGTITKTGSFNFFCGVYVAYNNSYFEMNGGTITGFINTASDRRGGVFVHDSTFEMNGGTITNCIATEGGGVYLNNASAEFIMNGGTISGNSATNCGGGVYIAKDGTFNMDGGTITNCSSQFGAGVYVYRGTFSMAGESTISDCDATVNGGGVYVNGKGDSASFTIGENAVISKCSAATSGGGVFIYCSDFKMTGGVIEENESKHTTYGGGGLCFCESGTVILTGGEIRENKAVSCGGGVEVVYATGDIILGGTIKIYDNTKGTDADNVFLGTSKCITLGTGDNEPKSGMSVGVTTQTKPTVGNDINITGTNGSNYSSYFTSDDPAYSVKNDSNVIKLIKNVSTVTTAPQAKESLKYNASAQELVTAGVAEHGTMKYAIGTDGTTVPTDASAWGTAIPTGTDVGTYYVWYKSAGDTNYADSTPLCVSVMVAKGTHAVTAPTALNPVYSGKEQALISAGSCTTGTIKYSLDGTDYYDSIDSIKKKEVGSYTVHYKVEGDGNYETYGPKSITAKIVKKSDPTPTPTPKPDPQPTPNPDPQPDPQPTIPVTSTVQYTESGRPIKNYVANNPTGSNIPLPYITADVSKAGWKTIGEALDAHKAKYKKNAVGTLSVTMNGYATVDTELITDAHEKKIPLSFALDDEVAIGIPVANSVLSDQAKEGKATYFKVSSMTTAEAVSVNKADAGLLPSDLVAIGGNENTPVVLTLCSNDKLSTDKSQLMTISFNASKAGYKKGDKVYLYCGTSLTGIAMYKMGTVGKDGFVTFSVPMVSNYWTIGSKNMKNKLLRNAVALPR